MNIIHIATFKGNIGDRINHSGFYKLLQSVWDEIKITQIELRDFYFSSRNRKYFNEELVQQINTYDVCVFGGGGFFDAQWADSNTGITLDMPDSFIYAINIPVLINAVGYHEYPDITNEKICKKFYNFINKIIKLKNWFVTVRNDGSYERLVKRYGKEICEKISKVPDNGFFCDMLNAMQEVKEKKIIGMCITNDLFSKSYNREIDISKFNKLMSEFINQQIFLGRDIILFPHTPDDINVIYELFGYIDNGAKRKHIIIAPYNACSNDSILQLAYYYKKCDCIVGMRFHSLVAAINLRIPVIALSGHEQIQALCEDLNIEQYCIKVDNLSFKKSLEKLIDVCLNDNIEICDIYNKIYSNYLNKMVKEYKKIIKKLTVK